MQPVNGCSRFSPVHDVGTPKTDRPRPSARRPSRPPPLSSRPWTCRKGMCIRIRLLRRPRCRLCMAHSMRGGRRGARLVARSFGRSVGRSVDGGTPYFAISPPPSTPLLPLALAVSRSPVEIAMILSGGIIGIHLQDERGRSECTFSVAHRDASNTHALA